VSPTPGFRHYRGLAMLPASHVAFALEVKPWLSLGTSAGNGSCARRMLHPAALRHPQAAVSQWDSLAPHLPPRFGRASALPRLRMTDYSVEGLQFVILTCGLLALASAATQKENADIVMRISDALLGGDEEPDLPAEKRRTGTMRRVMNPITGRMISQDGPFPECTIMLRRCCPTRAPRGADRVPASRRDLPKARPRWVIGRLEPL
jgi:hypothetical protein